MSRSVARLGVASVLAFGLVLGVVTPASATVYTFDVGDFSYTQLAESDTVMLTGVTGTNADVEIPAVVNDGSSNFTVVEVGPYALYANDDIHTISFAVPSNIATIGIDAFDTIPNLTSIVIPDSVITIDDYAFYGDPLSSLTLGSAVTTIGDYAFSGSTFATLDIPASMAGGSIGVNAFNNEHLNVVSFYGAAPATMSEVSSDASFGNSCTVPTLQFRYPNRESFALPTYLGYPSEQWDLVTFDSQGHGAATEPVYVVDGYSISSVEDPTAEGWMFGGWYTDGAFLTAVDFSHDILADATYFAKWTSTNPETPQTPVEPEGPRLPLVSC